MLAPTKYTESVVPASERFRLTMPQLSIWMDQALHPHRSIYNTGQVVTISAELSLERFTAVLRQVVAENDALRLRFVKGPDILQEIANVSVFDVAYRDFSTEGDPDNVAHQWIEQLFWSPLEPTDVPLFRFAVAKVAADRFAWLQKYHHLIIDATGRQLVVSRVAQLYQAESGDLEKAAPPKALSWRSVTSLEDEYLASSEFTADREYWQKRLTGLPRLPVRPSTDSEKSRSGRPTRIECSVTANAAPLVTFARRGGSSLFKLILAVVWICFNRLYSRSDFLVGIPLSGRPSADAKQIVGLLAKIMPFRINIGAHLTLSEALRVLEAALSEDLPHQRFPVERLAREIWPDRRVGPLFDVIVNYVRSDYGLTFGGAPVRCMNLSAGFAVPWGIMVLEYGTNHPIRILIDYDSGLITPAEAREFCDCFEELLAIASSSENVTLVDMATSVFREKSRCQAAMENASPRSPVIASRVENDVYRTVLDIWGRCFRSAELRAEDDFFELGGGSLKAIWLVGECNDRFNIDLPPTILFDNPRLERFVEAICSAMGKTSGRPILIPLKHGESRPRLLLVHPVGGTLFCYRELVSRLPQDLTIYGIRASGLEDGESLPQSLEDMAECYLEAAQQVVDGEGCYLAGWSFGGVVAYAMGSLLSHRGKHPAGVILIDSPLHPAVSRSGDHRRLVSAVVAAMGLDIRDINLPETSECDPVDLLAQISGNSANGDQVKRIVGVIENAQRIRARYIPRRFVGAVTLLRANIGSTSSDADFNWQTAVDGPVTTRFLDTTHDLIVVPPAVEQVAALITDIIDASKHKYRQ